MSSNGRDVHPSLRGARPRRRGLGRKATGKSRQPRGGRKSPCYLWKIPPTPRWRCSRGAPGSKRPASGGRCAGRSGPEHDLAERVALLELAVGVPDLAQRIDLGDRNLEPAFADEREELDEDLRTRRGGSPFRLDPVGLGRLPVRDG